MFTHMLLPAGIADMGEQGFLAGEMLLNSGDQVVGRRTQGGRLRLATRQGA